MWEKIKAQKTVIDWKAEVEEEFEDKDGNVYYKKLYDDLVRQNIIKI